MPKPLAPLLVRANATNRMRELREVIEELHILTEHVPASLRYAHIAKIQKLTDELNRLKLEHIHVVVDNTCS